MVVAVRLDGGAGPCGALSAATHINENDLWSPIPLLVWVGNICFALRLQIFEVLLKLKVGHGQTNLPPDKTASHCPSTGGSQQYSGKGFR